MTTAYSTPFDGIGVSPWHPRPPSVPAPPTPVPIPLPGVGGLVEAIRQRLEQARAEVETLERMLAAAEGRR